MKTKKSLCAIYCLPGFRARAKFKKGILGDPKARVIQLVRRQKKRFVRSAARLPRVITISAPTVLGILTVPICAFTWSLNTAEFTVNTAKP